MSDARPIILQVSIADRLGGAEKVAWNLFARLQESDCESWLAVRDKRSKHPRVLQIPNDECRSSVARRWGTAAHYLPSRTRGRVWALARKIVQRLGSGRRLADLMLGHEDFEYPGTWKVLGLTPRLPSILHCHNLHGDYFDLRALPWLSHQVPVVLTLHDSWLLAGHCGHPMECERWTIGCGNCPDLTIPPALVRDGTAYNWRKKQDIFSRSRLYVAAPSEWMIKKLSRSMLAPGIVEARIVRNGVDLSTFRSMDKMTARQAVGIPLDKKVILFAANGIFNNFYKDYRTIRSAVTKAAERVRDETILFIGLGEEAEPVRWGKAQARFLRYESDERTVASYYQSADLYVHGSLAETYPNSILESLACGTPVVATSVGGIPEQIEDGVTGFLVAAGDAEGMASRIAQLLCDDARRRDMGHQAAARASERFGMSEQVDTYRSWYGEILRNQG